jgi:hypothetical protein
VRAQALSGARGVCACEDTDLCICVYMCVECIGERACACVCMCVFFRAWAYRFVCMCVCARVCARSAHERMHAFVREFVCVCLVRWEALIAMLACAAGRMDAAPPRLCTGPLGGG